MNNAVSSRLAGLHLVTADALDLPQAAGPLPQLASGQTHEWFFSDASETPRAKENFSRRVWHPPLTVLAHFAGKAAREGTAGKARRIVWIGRNCWPTLQLLCALSNAPMGGVAESLRRSLFLDPLTDAERFWAIGHALRCPGVAAVVADGSGMNETVSRRLQLAAESGRSDESGGGVLGLLARPMRERDAPSWAATRWEVRPRSNKTDTAALRKKSPGPAWEIERISCRGQHREQDAPLTWLAAWSYQVFRGTGALHFSPGVGYRTAAAEYAPGGRRSAAPVKRHKPLLLMITTARQETVARCCAQCAAAGIRPGMTVAEAKALCPIARVVPFDVNRSRQAMELLAKWAFRFSPVVAVDRHFSGRFADDVPEGLLLDVTGEAHLFGSEHLLLTEITTRLKKIGFTSRLAIAPAIGAAWALARFGPHPLAVTAEEQMQQALEPLSIAGLRISAETIVGLRQIGIEEIRHLLTLRREKLLTRFGDELLLRLDQAMGRATELIEPIRIAEALGVHRVFEGATTQLEAVTVTVQELLAVLHEKLLEHESGIRGIRVELKRINMPPASRELVVGCATRDARHIWNLLRPRVEQMHLGHGVEEVTLTAYWVEKIRHRQTGAWETGEIQDTHDQEYEAFLDTLVNRWGNARVLVAHPVASHMPEVVRQFRSVREKVPLTPKAEPTDILFVDRPSILFDHPEIAEVTFLQPDHPPSQMHWRNTLHTLTNGSGPERIVTAWWGARLSSTRDYFKTQTEHGLWVWLFRELETDRWFVHGLWA